MIELIVTVTLVATIAVPLTGVVIEYFKTTVQTSARLNESHDVQFAAAYWQRDVASIGVRSDTYDDSDSVHTFPLTKSVSADGSLASCSLPTGTKVITLGWSTFALDASANPSQTRTTATYVAVPVVSGAVTTYVLKRVLCSGSTLSSTLTLADHLTAAPTPTCSGGGVTGCADSSGAVPTKITLSLTSTDPKNNDGSTYQQTLLGERRQT
jgi:hypothetical protein